MAQLGICEYPCPRVSPRCSPNLSGPDTIYLATYNYLGDVYDRYSVGHAVLPIVLNV